MGLHPAARGEPVLTPSGFTYPKQKSLTQLTLRHAIAMPQFPAGARS
jgi:hypothetical protein